MSEVRIREYRRADLDAMYALDVVCFAPEFRFSRRAMQRFAEAPGATALISEGAGGVMAGFGIVEVEGGLGYVVTLDVDPAWRRLGVARRLLAALEARAVAVGAAEMRLHVFAGNLAAQRLYEAVGYAVVGVARGFYGRGLDGVVYRKRLVGDGAG